MSSPTNRSVTPTRDTRLDAAPLDEQARGLEEETLQEVEELREHELDSFESQHEPNSQADVAPVMGIDRDDSDPNMPGASRLDVPELVELARRKRRETIIAYPRTGKDGWMSPVPAEAGGPAATLLHNVRWWFFPCKQGGMPPFKYDGAIDLWRKTVVASSEDRVYLLQRDDPMHTLIPRLDNYEDVEIMSVARPMRGGEGMGAATVGKGHRSYTGVLGPEMPKGKGFWTGARPDAPHGIYGVRCTRC